MNRVGFGSSWLYRGNCIDWKSFFIDLFGGYVWYVGR